MYVEDIRKTLASLGDPEQAAALQGFFKTGPGGYAEGDLFRGIRVPMLRKLSRQYRHVTAEGAGALLTSAYHEDRLFGLLLLVGLFSKADEAGKTQIYRLYLDHTRHINNWDLVDSSAEHIVGAYLEDRSREPLYRLAASESLWERRIALLSTFHFIKRGDFEDALQIIALLLNDRRDLIHKAAGWMLREVGNRAPAAERAFLQEHYRHMPRTMLRYAIEKFPESERQQYLRGEV